MTSFSASGDLKTARLLPRLMNIPVMDETDGPEWVFLLPASSL